MGAPTGVLARCVMKYRIIGQTNSWIAQRDGLFRGKERVVINSGLSLKEAKDILLKYFCRSYDVYFPNWGVVMNSRLGRDYASHFKDGTYSYEYDSRYFRIEEEE